MFVSIFLNLYGLSKQNLIVFVPVASATTAVIA